MSQLKFAIGEVVILQSKSAPNLNGEYAITQIVFPGEIYTDPKFGQQLCSDELGYGLEGHPWIKRDSGGNPAVVMWKESALRKRHQPGEYTFEGLKTILSMPVDRKDFA